MASDSDSDSPPLPLPEDFEESLGTDADIAGAAEDAAAAREHHPAAAAAPCRAAVVQHARHHMDVLAGFAYAFTAAGCEVDVALPAGPSTGIEGVISGGAWFQGSVLSVPEFVERAADYSAVVLITYPPGRAADDLLAPVLAAHEGLEGEARAALRYVLVAHHPEALAEPPYADLIRRAGAPLHIVSLAPFVAAGAAAALAGAGLDPPPPAHWLSPLMPIAAPGGGGAQLGGWAQRAEAPTLCIQGNIDPSKRDYAAVFRALGPHLPELEALGARLLLLGHRVPGAEVEVPEALAQRVEVLEELPFEVRGRAPQRRWAGRRLGWATRAAAPLDPPPPAFGVGGERYCP